MIQTTQLSERMERVFTPTPRGVVGLVDLLLEVVEESSEQHNVRYCEDRVEVSTAHDSCTVMLPKSVFRAMLARIAAILVESNHANVTPYDGSGQINTLSVRIQNTPAEQRLELTPVPTPL